MSDTLTLTDRPRLHRVRPICVEPVGRRVTPWQLPWDCVMAPGDAVLYRADATLEDLLVAGATHCIWIHVGMLAWNEDLEQWEIIDTRQWQGGKRTPLIEAVRANPGHWDLFHTNPQNRWPEYNRRLAVAKMDEFVDRPYGWASLLADAWTHLPVVGGLFVGDLASRVEDGRPPYCSQSFVIATRVAGGIDMVPHRPDCYCEPVHVAESLFCEYSGTFWPAEEVEG
jgi:hypothetical protein